MTQRYECEFRKTDGRWAIVDHKFHKAIGSLGNRMVAEQVVRELNTLEAGTEKPEEYACRCHKRMGNDFYFLPKGQCLFEEGCHHA